MEKDKKIGPWKSKFQEIYDQEGDPVFQIVGLHCDEHERVISLITAAPDMLKALKAIYESMSKTISLSVDWTPLPGMHTIGISTIVRPEDIELMKFAIAKAKGEV